MKTLLKISLVFVFALFVSMSVKAQLTSQTVPDGTITVNVPAHLALTVTDANVSFDYLEYTNGAQPASNGTTVAIAANVNWKLSVYSAHSTFEKVGDPTKSFVIGKVSHAGVVADGPLGYNYANASVLTGTGNMAATSMTWTLTTLGNQFFGVYTAPVSYYLEQIAPL